MHLRTRQTCDAFKRRVGAGKLLTWLRFLASVLALPGRCWTAAWRRACRVSACAIRATADLLFAALGIAVLVSVIGGVGRVLLHPLFR